MLPEKRNDLQRVQVADDAEAASPWKAVPVIAHEIPPEPHLDVERSTERGQNILSIGERGSFPDIAGIFIRIAIEPADGRGVVRIYVAACERAGCAIDEGIKGSAIAGNAHAVSNGCRSRRDAKIVFRKID